MGNFPLGIDLLIESVGTQLIDLTNEDVMYSLRGDLGIGVVTSDPGRASGIAAKCRIAQLLGIEINAVNYFKSLLEG